MTAVSLQPRQPREQYVTSLLGGHHKPPRREVAQVLFRQHAGGVVLSDNMGYALYFYFFGSLKKHEKAWDFMGKLKSKKTLTNGKNHVY
jgi:hypothetical protein